ncbi:MAG: o-succinylbenzoate synthase [Halorientalis sp.]
MNVERFTLRLAEPLRTAAGTVEQRDGFLVHIPYAGMTGVGEATPLRGWTESLSDCRDALERAPDLAREEDWGVALGETTAPAARHALSLALAEARAAARGQPLYRLLGGDERVEHVQVNATVGDAPPAETADRAAAAVERGFECVKVKVGVGDPETDVERLRAVREAVGADVDLRADANGAWTRSEADRVLARVASLDLAYVEQPLPAEEVAEHASLRAEHDVPLALDESLSVRSVVDLLGSGAADYLVLKPMVLGGPDRTCQAAREAREAGVTPVVSTTIDGVVARTGAVHVAAAIGDLPPSGLATGDLLAEDLGPDPAPVDNGRIQVPQTEGLGVRPDA